MDKIILSMNQNLKRLSKHEQQLLINLCHASKNLANDALYNLRQHYFKTKKLLDERINLNLLKQRESFKMLHLYVAEQVIKSVTGDFKSFVKRQELRDKGIKKDTSLKIPRYHEKDALRYISINFRFIKDEYLNIPFGKTTNDKLSIKIPPVLKNKKIIQARLIPLHNGLKFNVLYLYEKEQVKNELDYTKGLAVDLGINNLATCATNYGKSFIIDGRKLKSINHWFNKENARLQSIKDKQKYEGKFTKRQYLNINKRKNRIYDFMSKAVKYIIEYCVKNKIGNLVCGYSRGMKEEIVKEDKMKQNVKQSFTGIPFILFLDKIKYMCKLNMINFFEQEESYTSVASFLDKDYIPIYKKGDNENCNVKFSGKRISRGMYQSADGTLINADLNGALNILRKSNVVSLEKLYSNGKLETPIRIRI